MERKLVLVTLAIPTINRTQPFFDTINSLLLCDPIPNEIIILDQNSTDLFDKNSEFLKTKEKELENVTIKHIHLETSGSSYSRNRAFEMTSNSILVFSDDDVLFDGVIFEQIYKRMAKSNVSMIAGIDYNSQYKKRNLAKNIMLSVMGLGSLSIKKAKVTYGLFGCFPNRIHGTINTEWGMGFLLAVNKDDVIKSSVLFEEKFTKYGYAEDLDFSYRFYKWTKKNKKKCIICSSIGVRHMVSSQNRLSSKQLYLKVFVNRQFINYKLHGRNLFFLLVLNWSNFWYRHICKKQDKSNCVILAFRRFCKIKKYINQGYLYDDFYDFNERKDLQTTK